MRYLYLIRHAETALNASRTVQWPNTPLNRHGMWQARRLGSRFRDTGLTQIISSDYLRAQTTAEQIKNTSKAELTLDSRLRERALGELRGLPYATVNDRLFSNTFVPNGGESLSTFHARVSNMWAFIRAEITKTKGSLAVVTHGFVCMALAHQHLQLDTEEEHSITFANASVTIVDTHAPWRVHVLACENHLS